MRCVPSRLGRGRTRRADRGGRSLSAARTPAHRPVGVDEGTRAPDFTLLDDANREVTLSKELGAQPIVLNWYVFDFTRVCTTQMCDLRDRLDGFRKTGARLFGISTDSPHSHRVFRASLNLPYRLLSDWGGHVSERYGVLYDSFHGFPRVSKRAVFILDPAGVVRYRWVAEDAGIAPIADEILVATRSVGERSGVLRAGSGDE